MWTAFRGDILHEKSSSVFWGEYKKKRFFLSTDFAYKELKV